MICYFNKATFRGTFGNPSYPPTDNEFVEDLPPSMIGDFINTPSRYTYQNGVFAEYPGWSAEHAAEVAAVQLATAKSNKNAELTNLYNAIITANIAFTTAAGTTKDFQADDYSQQVLLQVIVGLMSIGQTPQGFYWKAADNTHVTPFTYADLQNMSTAMLLRGQVAYYHLQDKKTAVEAAATISDVQNIVW